MSKKYNARVACAKSILDYVGGPRYYKTEKLSSRDRETSRCAIALWLMILWDKCISSLQRDCETSRNGLMGRVLQLARLQHDVNLYDFLATLDAASQYLLDTTTGEKPMSYSHFKREIVSSCQDSVQEQYFCTVLGLVKRLCRGWFVSSDEAAFRDLRAIFCFLGRLSLKDVKSLKETALETWFESEIKDWKQDFSGPERNVISEWFPIEDTAIIAEYYAPKHGAGSTFEGISSSFEKSQLNEVPQLVQQIETCLGFEYWTSRNVLMASPTPEDYQPYVESDPEAHYHRVYCVPKNWKTYRIISLEEIGLMFAQQGAMAAIFDYLRNGHSEFAKHYCVNTEHLNRELSQLGSIDGAYATLDMSAASDSVAWKLVELWFSESCLSHLVSLRSQYAVLNNMKYKNIRLNDVYKVSKFAPMGSALCFPVECIVFGAIVEAILRKHFGRRHNRKWYVYGDDLVVPVEIVAELIARLTALGFKVNVSKSYYNVPDDRSKNIFRESCGGEYLNGINVTPPRIPRKFEGLYYQEDIDLTEKRVRSIAKLVTLANDLFEHSPTARWAIVNRLLNKDQLALPIYTDTTGERGIRTTSPTNYHLRRIINVRTHQVEVQCWQLRSKRKSLDLLYVSREIDNLYKEIEALEEQELDVPPWYYEAINRELKFESDRMWQGLGPVLLYEYLRLAERKNRNGLIAPDDAIEVIMDPRSHEMSLQQAFLPDSYDSRIITSPSDWSYSIWNTDKVWSGTNALHNHRKVCA